MRLHAKQRRLRALPRRPQPATRTDRRHCCDVPPRTGTPARLCAARPRRQSVQTTGYWYQQQRQHHHLHCSSTTERHTIHDVQHSRTAGRRPLRGLLTHTFTFLHTRHKWAHGTSGHMVQYKWTHVTVQEDARCESPQRRLRDRSAHSHQQHSQQLSLTCM